MSFMLESAKIKGKLGSRERVQNNVKFNKSNFWIDWDSRVGDQIFSRKKIEDIFYVDQF